MYKRQAIGHFDVWHSKLGRMSLGKMNLGSIHAKFHNKGKQLVREIYRKAKQHRLPFPVSHILSTSTSELLRIDTWGR